MSDVSVRPVRFEDHDTFTRLYTAYRDVSGHEPSEEIVERAWALLSDPGSDVRGLVGELDDKPVAIALYRTFPRPADGDTGLWLDEMYTDESARGNGVASALVDHLSHLAQIEGRGVVRWMTAQDNTPARSLYRQVASETSWVLYESKPGAVTGHE